MMEMQAKGIRVLPADIFRYPVDILHQLDRVLESVCIDPLDEVRLDLRHAGAVVADVVHLIGVVDVAHFNLFVGEERTRDPECFSDFLEFAGG